MPAAGSIAIPPPIIWAQRSDVLIVTIAVECKEEEYNFTEDSMHFKAAAVNTDRTYDVTLNFLHKIVPDKVTTKKTAQCNIQFTIPRAEAGDYWNSLTTDKKKPHFLKVDFNLWVDESQQDEQEEGGMPGMGGMGGNDMDMMKMFGQSGLGGAGDKHNFDDLDDAEDSDDEDLPNLE